MALVAFNIFHVFRPNLFSDPTQCGIPHTPLLAFLFLFFSCYLLASHFFCSLSFSVLGRNSGPGSLKQALLPRPHYGTCLRVVIARTLLPFLPSSTRVGLFVESLSFVDGLCRARVGLLSKHRALLMVSVGLESDCCRIIELC